MVDEPFCLPPTTKEGTRSVDAVRGFVFSSGRSWMQERGLFERYLSQLPSNVRARAFSITALEWIPLDEAMASYAACDKLDLSAHDKREVGAVVSSANNGVVVDTLVRLAGGIGLSPWVALRSMHKVWLRSNRGGAVAVYKLGERVARIELWKVPLVESEFFRTSMCGAVEAGLSMFRKGAQVTEISELGGPDGMALRAAW